MSSTDSFSRDSLHEQAARARKLHRLRQVVDAAQDPSDVFEATADLLEAMMDAGASFCCSSETTAAATPASSCSEVLALTLCAALSEPVLRHGEASSTSLASLSDAGSGSLLQSSPSPGRGNTPTDGSMQPSKRMRRRSPPVAASAGAAGQLQTCYSMPYPGSTGLELAGDPADSLAAAQWSSADLELRRGLSTAQLEVSTHKPQHSPPRSAHSCLQLQGTLQQQQQQQLMHNRQSLQELLRQRLLRTASLDLQPQAQQQQQQQDPLYQQLQYRQQQQIAGLQRQAQQKLLTLHQHRQGQQQGLGQQVLQQQPDTDHKADMLDRLKRAIAVTIARNSLTQA